MRIFTALTLILALQIAHATDEISNDSAAVFPIGAIPKNSKVILEPADRAKTYFTTSYDEVSTNFDKIDTSSLYDVKSVSPELATPETADLQALATQKMLMLQKSDLTPSAANCQTSNNLTNCTLNTDVPVYKSGFFDFLSYFLGLLNPKNRFSSKTGIDQNTDKEVAQAINKTIDKANSKTSANGKSIMKECDPKDSAQALSLGDKDLQCGIRQALEAYKNNKSRIKQDVIIFNDFSTGGNIGKMWFINPDGGPARVLDQNPIQVSRGVNGFGSGMDSLKTPHGAVLTGDYNPPRAGNIEDGIELIGLEAGNKNTHSRGVLLHGWDPHSPTAGCLGVSGEIDTKSKGKRLLGSPPPYLDQLKKGLLKDGGVLIYNFTPAKKSLCKSYTPKGFSLTRPL